MSIYISGSGGSGGSASDKGWYATESALTTAIPTGEDGDFAIVGATDTFWTWDSTSVAWVNTGSASTGNVIGPGSATDNAITRFDATTGKLIQNSSATIDDSGNITANGFVGDVTGNADTVTTNANLTGPVTSTGNATTITDEAVTNAKLAHVATATIKGRATAATGDVEDLTGAQATTLLDDMVGDSGAGGTKGLAPAPASGDAASGKYLKADGTWAVPPGSGDVVGPGSATDNAVARYDATTGKLIQSSSVIIDDSDAVTGITSLTVDNVSVDGGSISTTTGNMTFAAASGSIIKANSDISSSSLTKFIGNYMQNSSTNTLSGNLALTSTSANIQYADPNGAERDITAEATPTSGRLYLIYNTGSANNLIFKNNAGTAIGNPIKPNTVARFSYSTSWREFDVADQALNTSDNVSFNSMSIDSEGFQTGDAIDSVTVQGSSYDIRTKIEQDGTGNAAQLTNIKHVDSATACPRTYNLKSRGSKSSPSIVQDDDIVACWVTGAYDGTEYRITSVIRTEVNEASPATGNIGADLIFFVSTGSTFEEVLRLDKDKVAKLAGGLQLNDSGFTASEILALDGSKNVQTLSVATYPSLAELAYVKGVTSAIQTQLDSKIASLQEGYNSDENILTDATNGALKIQRGSASDGDEVLQVLNGAGTKTFAIEGDGHVYLGHETASTLLSCDSSNQIKSLSTVAYPSLAEIAYVKGVTSAIQTQLDDLAAQTVTTESGTSRTLALTDAKTYIRCTNAATTTITVPPNSSVAFSIGDQIDVFQAGAGQVVFAEGSGVTINKAEGLKISAQYKAAALKKVATDEWDLIGALAA